MKNTQILEMLNAGQIEELTVKIKEEIYQDSLKKDTGAKQRYAAMKRFFKYGISNKNTPALTMPYNIDTEYTSFCDGHGAALTKESIGELEMYDEGKHGKYVDVLKLFPTSDNGYSVFKNVSFAEIFAKAKADGYKLKKATAEFKEPYVVKMNNHYFNLAVIDKVISILDDGNGFEVWVNTKNSYSTIFVFSSIGKGIICPVNPNAIKDSMKIYELYLN